LSKLAPLWQEAALREGAVGSLGAVACGLPGGGRSCCDDVAEQSDSDAATAAIAVRIPVREVGIHITENFDESCATLQVPRYPKPAEKEILRNAIDQLALGNEGDAQD
jgi:hypothetical protein